MVFELELVIGGVVSLIVLTFFIMLMKMPSEIEQEKFKKRDW